MSYVVGFNRDRDSYQVPLALAEVGALNSFVTDYYHGASKFRVSALAHRKSPGLPDTLVNTVPSAFVAQLAHRGVSALGYPAPFPADFVDRRIGRAVRRRIEADPKAHLLVYSNYAYEAFRADGERNRVLFQYHPGRSAVVAALAQDELASAGHWQPETEVVSSRRARRYEAELEMADCVLVASRFTKQGLVRDGVSPDRVSVCPYGCPPIDRSFREDRALRFVFVGQGVQRKGLHILFAAWRRANLRMASLTVISSRVDPAITEFAQRLGVQVDIRSGLTNDQVRAELGQSDTLVLPSLVEGFGLVIGEAMASGCRVIASRNTGLVDLALTPRVGRLVDPGSVADLTTALQDAESSFSPKGDYRDEVYAVAAQNNWRRFRADVRSVVL